MKVFETNDNLHLDPYSELTMTYTIDGFNELKVDIMSNGQLTPITLREGKILDGRHRYRACVDLGLEVRCTEVGNITDEEALTIVISNSINKSTGTDAAKVEAYLICKAKGLNQKEMSSLFSRLNMDHTRKMAYIEKENPEYLQALLRQNSVSLHNMQFDKLEYYGTINGIWRTLKGNSKFGDKVVEVSQGSIQDVNYEVYIDEVMPNPTAEQEFWDVYATAKISGNKFSPSDSLGKIIIGYIVDKHI